MNFQPVEQKVNNVCLFCYKNTCRLKFCKGCTPEQWNVLEEVRKNYQCIFCAIGTCKNHKKIEKKTIKKKDSEWKEVPVKKNKKNKIIQKEEEKENIITVPAPKNGTFYDSKIKEDREIMTDIIFIKFFIEKGKNIYEHPNVKGKWVFNYQDVVYSFTPEKLSIKTKKKNTIGITFKKTKNNCNITISYAEIANKIKPEIKNQGLEQVKFTGKNKKEIDDFDEESTEYHILINNGNVKYITDDDE